LIRGHHERRATRRFVQVAQALAYRIQIGIDAVQAGPFGFRQQGFQLAAPRPSAASPNVALRTSSSASMRVTSSACGKP
jgi:hypothetical protein